MRTKNYYIFLILLILASFGLSIWAFPQLPDSIATHWDIAGNANDYSDKFFGLFLMPTIILLLSWILSIVPKIDPKTNNHKANKSDYHIVVIAIIIFLLIIHKLTILWNLGWQFNFSQLMSPIIGVFYIVLGQTLKNVKQNWFMGIRTPWTLSSEKVWEKTHLASSQVFTISGIIAMLGFIFPTYAIWFLVFPIIGSSIWLSLYSYVLYSQEHLK